MVPVSHADAMACAGWLSAATGRSWTLPTELQWEKAAHGANGRRFPWDDKGCGVCRPAARHSRPAALKHILIGFRPVRETPRAAETDEGG